jgi:predicted XRE-type DNA-binding protein
MVRSKSSVTKHEGLSARKTPRKTKGPEHEVEFYESCGNVFKDIGIPDEEATYLLMRGTLMIEIEQTIRARGWTQAHAAKVIGVAQPRIAELFSSRVDLFSIDTLIKYLYKLGREVTINVKDSLLT